MIILINYLSSSMYFILFNFEISIITLICGFLIILFIEYLINNFFLENRRLKIFFYNTQIFMGCCYFNFVMIFLTGIKNENLPRKNYQNEIRPVWAQVHTRFSKD